jgi:hypothetical protein
VIIFLAKLLLMLKLQSLLVGLALTDFIKGMIHNLTLVTNMINNSAENLRELSQPQERFAPKFKRNQEKISFFFMSSSFLFF